jgi:hypothetical protein
MDYEDISSLLEVKKLLKLYDSKGGIKCDNSEYNFVIYSDQGYSFIVLTEGDTVKNDNHKSLTNNYENAVKGVIEFNNKKTFQNRAMPLVKLKDKRIWIQDDMKDGKIETRFVVENAEKGNLVWVPISTVVVPQA